jgi:hypothetical protein
MPLNPAQQAELRTASASSLEQVFGWLPQYWKGKDWLRSENRYRGDCIDKIKADAKTTATKLVPSVRSCHLNEYIAASTIGHCMDGWGFLGRALLCHMLGDMDVARHLGYYAELRATMALLASEGIGVFDKKHLVVQKPRKSGLIPGDVPTHFFIWDALEQWASFANAHDKLLRVIVPAGEPLREWLTRFSVPAASMGLLAEEWLRQWGLDLRRMTEDRKSRNLVSYRPSVFTSPRSKPAKQSLQFVRHLWELCEPTSRMRFRRLDRFLLRSSLELAFKRAHAHNRSRKQAAKMYEHHVDAMLHQLGPIDLSEGEWRRFLTFRDHPAVPQIILEAGGDAEPSDPEHDRQVLSRAMLLLRLASGACEVLLKSLPSFSRDDIDFWWTTVGNDRSLWSDTNRPDEITDLWTEVGEAFQVLEQWENDSPDDVSYSQIWKEQAAAAAVLGSCERIGLWGMGL